MNEAKKTYLKIASCLVDERNLLNFYIEFHHHQDVFGIYPPTKTIALGCNGPFFIDELLNNQLEHIAEVSEVLANYGSSNYLNIEQRYTLSVLMYLNYCDILNIESFVENYKNVFYLESTPNDKLIGEMLDLKEFVNWDEMYSFYEKDNYSQYVQFVQNFISVVKKNANIIQACYKPSDLFILELAIKNIGRPHFVVIEPYFEVFEVSNGTMNDKPLRIKQREEILNFSPLRKSFDNNTFRSTPWLFNLDLSLSTHIEISQKKHGDYEIKKHLPFSINKGVGSNFSAEINDQDVVRVNLKDVLRNSQNYLDFITSKKHEPDINLLVLIEYLSPFYPIDYMWEYLDIDFEQTDDFSIEEILMDMRYSPIFKFLEGRHTISKRFKKYCDYLFTFLVNYRIKEDGNRRDLYQDDFYVYLPFWEIPRIQSIRVENYSYRLHWKWYREELEVDAEIEEQKMISKYGKNYWKDDGLDDFSNSDVNWYWNID